MFRLVVMQEAGGGRERWAGIFGSRLETLFWRLQEAKEYVSRD